MIKMKIKLKIEKEYDAKTLKVRAGTRYCEDATVNKVEDTKGELMPFLEGVKSNRKGEFYSADWVPEIDIESGVIKDWPVGKSASVHYKCCDDGEYTLLDSEGDEIITISGYVPEIMCPVGEGYGDYIIMNIDESGKIDKWNPGLSDFITEED